MSMPSLAVSADNPVTKEDVLHATRLVGKDLTLSEEELESYHRSVAAAHESCETILKLPDYMPVADVARFSRLNVHRPTAAQNPTNGWAWKCTVRERKPTGGKLLSGRTLCLKDNYALAEVPCLYGTEVFKDWMPNIDATAAKRALEHGATITGKAVCENLSIFANSASAATGPMHNPRAKGYSAGGSSSGCAVLVASGQVDMALGGDQGGSIRLPASHVGIVGLKPTFGLVPFTGIGSVDPTIDYTGPMTKTVLDAASLLKAVAGADGIDDRQLAGCPLLHQVPDYPNLCQKSIKGLRIGIIKESLSFAVSDKRISEMVINAAHLFREQGAVVEEVSIPSHALGADVWSVVARWAGSQTLLSEGIARRQLYMNDLHDKMANIKKTEGWSKVFPATKNLILCGTYMREQYDAKVGNRILSIERIKDIEECRDHQLLGKAMNLNRMVKDDYDEALSKYDVLVTPTLPFLPRKLADTTKSPVEILGTVAGAVLNTAGLNLTGHPAISIPIGELSDGEADLPVGMQLISKWWRDDLVLQAAFAWEAQNDWTQMRY